MLLSRCSRQEIKRIRKRVCHPPVIPGAEDTNETHNHRVVFRRRIPGVFVRRAFYGVPCKPLSEILSCTVIEIPKVGTISANEGFRCFTRLRVAGETSWRSLSCHFRFLAACSARRVRMKRAVSSGYSHRRRNSVVPGTWAGCHIRRCLSRASCNPPHSSRVAYPFRFVKGWDILCSAPSRNLFNPQPVMYHLTNNGNPVSCS
jgi:hypothetical protein